MAVEAVGGDGIGIAQALGMVRHNGIVALYGDTYAPIKELRFTASTRTRWRCAA